MDLRRLQFLVRVIETGSITRAAATLRIAQPALSQHIQALERSAGAKLLIRSKDGVTATDAGMAAYRNAKLLARQLERARTEVRTLAAVPAGRVTVGMAPHSHARRLIQPLLQAAAKRYPRNPLAHQRELRGRAGRRPAHGPDGHGPTLRDRAAAGVPVAADFDRRSLPCGAQAPARPRFGRADGHASHAAAQCSARNPATGGSGLQPPPRGPADRGGDRVVRNARGRGGRRAGRNRSPARRGSRACRRTWTGHAPVRRTGDRHHPVAFDGGQHCGFRGCAG